MGIEDFNERNCELYKPVGMFMAIYKMSGENPCKGCACVPTCSNYYRINPGQTMPKPAKPFEAPKRKGNHKNKNKLAF